MAQNSMVWIFAGFVATFTVWPFVLVTRRRSVGPAFHATIAVQLILAGVIGSMIAIPVAGVQISIGNIAYAAVIMTTVAMFAATRALRVVRDAVLLVLAVNAVSLAVLALSSAALEGSAISVGNGIPATAFAVSIPALIVGTLLHVIEIVAVVWLVERTRDATRSKVLVACATLASFVAVLAFDGWAFPALATWWQPELANVLTSGWSGVAGKLLLGATFGLPLALFLALFQRPVAFDEPDLDLRGMLFAPRRRLLTRLSEAVEATDVLTDRLTATMDRVADGIIALDYELRVTFINGAAARLLRLGAPLPISAPLDDVFDGSAAAEVVAAARHATSSGAPQTVITEDVTPGRFLELRLFPERSELTVFVRDVTEQHEHERHLERLANAEQQAADQLRQIDRMKNAFLTAVSHELRTPLTVVRGLAETIHRAEQPEGPAMAASDRTAVVDALVDNTQRLARLLDDLLDLDRLIRGVTTITPSRHDLVALIRGQLEELPIEVPVAFESPESLDAQVDRVRIERIVTNLLSNAVKYADATTITVRLTSDGDNARIEVRDRGPGIAPEQLEEIFEPFYRADHDHPRPGTGIGLTLVREFAVLHGGRAWAIDTNREGAHFVVEVPLQQPDETTDSGATNRDVDASAVSRQSGDAGLS